jgi:histidine triad (HIT) family protein
MNDCIFCKIVAGTIPSDKVYENEHVCAFLDINPVHLGHTLVVPKRHSEDVFSINAEDWGHVSEAVRMLAPKVKTAAGADGINLIMNNKKSAGQLVDHAHVHIIPRFMDDGLKGLVKPKRAPEAILIAEMAKKIASL